MASIYGYEQESSLLCLGCGKDVMNRSDNRRALQGADHCHFCSTLGADITVLGRFFLSISTLILGHSYLLVVAVF